MLDPSDFKSGSEMSLLQWLTNITCSREVGLGSEQEPWTQTANSETWDVLASFKPQSAHMKGDCYDSG
jgi:hypothetical protein